MHACIFVCAWVRACVCLYIYTYVRIYIHTVCVYIRIYIHTYQRAHAWGERVLKYTRIYIHTYRHTHTIYTYIHTHIPASPCLRRASPETPDTCSIGRLGSITYALSPQTQRGLTHDAHMISVSGLGAASLPKPARWKHIYICMHIQIHIYI